MIVHLDMLVSDHFYMGFWFYHGGRSFETESKTSLTNEERQLRGGWWVAPPAKAS